MPWLDGSKSHSCPKPTRVEPMQNVNTGSRWQCPECFKIWTVHRIQMPDQREPDIEPYIVWRWG